MMAMTYDDAQNPVHRWQSHYQHLTSTVGLFTHANGDYSLIDVQDEKVYAAGITFTAAGQSLLQEYKDKHSSGSSQPLEIGGIDEQIMEETYLMSQALYYSSWVEIGEYDNAVIGATHMYGWHFNWDGSKAATVTHENKIVLPAGPYIYHIEQIWRLYVVSIAEDQDGILSASIELQEESKSEINNGDLRIWVPNNIGDQMGVIPYLFCTESGVDGYGESDFDVPMYCFYKPDGNLKIIRFYRYWIGAGDHRHHVDAAGDVNCPAKGWMISSPGTISGNYTGRERTSVQGFKVDGVTMEAMQGKGYTRNRWFQRVANGKDGCGSHPGWSNPQLSAWTMTDWEDDCSDPYDCSCCSGVLHKTHETELEFEEYESAVGSPDIGSTNHIFCLVIDGRSTDSVHMFTWQQTYHTMTYTHRYSYGHDDVVQVARGDNGCTTTNLTTVEGVWSPFGGCAEQDSLSLDGGMGWHISSGSPGVDELSITSSYLYETNVYLANPHETVRTDNIENTWDGSNPYEGYFRPTICSAIPEENLWSDVRSFCGRSIRSESNGGAIDGSNCEIPEDLPGTAGYWAGWS